MPFQSYGEARTASDQNVSFVAKDIGQEDARRLIAEHFIRLEPTLTHKTEVEHGGYSRYSRYDIEQKEYWSSARSFYEILEIKDAPEGRHPFVSYAHSVKEGGSPESYFLEWESIEAAVKHVKKRGAPTHHELFGETNTSIPGLQRAVQTNLLSPWFYATGNAELLGDYVFPEKLSNDPVYTLNRRFLVPITSWRQREPEYTALKTCIGAVDVETTKVTYRGYSASSDNPANRSVKKHIQWADGSMTVIDETTPMNLMPRAVEDEPWLTDAIEKVQQMLSGKALSFTVNFADGGKFVGRFYEAKESTSDPEGDYLLKVIFEDGSVKKGWVYEFRPTPECPTIASKAVSVYEARGMKTVGIEVLERRVVSNGKKWKGMYYNRRTEEDATQSQSDETIDIS